MPWWIWAACIGGMSALFAPVILATRASLWWFAFPVAVGAFMGSIFWLSIARRWIRVDGASLLIGDRKPIQLGQIAEARVVDGDELRRVRQAMIEGRGLPAGAAALPAIPVAGGMLGNAALGYSLVRGRSRYGRLWGMLAQPWMRRAVLVAVPEDKRAPVLLIGSRRPEELLAALRGGTPAAAR